MKIEKMFVNINTTPESIQIEYTSSNPKREPLPSIIFSADQCFQHSISLARQMFVNGFLAQRALLAVYDVVQINNGDEITLTIEVDDDDPISSQLLGLRLGCVFHRAFPVLPRSHVEEMDSQLAKLQSENSWIVSKTDLSIVKTAFKKDFLRRVPSKERLAILHRIDGLNPPAKDQLLAFQLGDWSHQIFQQDDWPLLALKAFCEGNLNENQISKLFLYDQCIIESPPNSPVQCYQLFAEKKKLNPDAAHLLERGLGIYFSPEEKQKLWRDLEQLPLPDGVFFAVESPIFAQTESSLILSLSNGKIPDVAADILRIGDFSFFLVEEKEGHGLQLVVPPALLEAILRSKFGSIAMKPNPVLGYFKKERLSLVDSRVVTIPCRYVSQPDRVHKLSATRLTSYFHDAAYHLFLESGNPHRAAWVELAQISASLGSEIQITIFDREFPLYSRPEIHNNIVGKSLEIAEEKFWHTMSHLISKVRFQYGNDKVDPMISLFLDHIAQHNTRWKQEYGIDLHNLKKMDSITGFWSTCFTALQAYSPLVR